MRHRIGLIGLLAAVLSCATTLLAGQAALAGCASNVSSARCASGKVQAAKPSSATVSLSLTVPKGAPLRIAIDKKVRITHDGEPIQGRIIETVYAMDEPVIPAGSTVTGRIVKIDPVPAKTRVLSYAGGDFTPFHKYQVTFDSLVLPNGKRYAIRTTVSPGIPQTIHLVAFRPGANVSKHRGTIGRAVNNARLEAKTQVHETLGEIRSPHIPRRVKEFLVAQLPYHRQYLKQGTQFNAALDEPLDFGRIRRTAEQLSKIGQPPKQDTMLHARLVSGVSSANAKRGAAVTAVLTKPVFSKDHYLLLPANSRLIGQVLQVMPARSLHRNGELRIAFNRIETPEGLNQAMVGSLEAVDVDRTAHLKLDEEGGAHATTSKKRYLATGLSILVAAAASHPDVEHGTTNPAGDAPVRAGAGAFGSRLTGCLIALAARSQPVSIAFGAYSASTSIYSNFLSHGKNVVFPKNMPLEIDFGSPPTPVKATTKP